MIEFLHYIRKKACAAIRQDPADESVGFDDVIQEESCNLLGGGC